MLTVISSAANNVSRLPLDFVFIFASEDETIIFPSSPDPAAPLCVVIVTCTFSKALIIDDAATVAEVVSGSKKSL